MVEIYIFFSFIFCSSFVFAAVACCCIFFIIFSSELFLLFCFIPNTTECVCVCVYKYGGWGSFTKQNCLRFADLEPLTCEYAFFVVLLLMLLLLHANTFGMLPMEEHSVYFLNDWKIMLIISTNTTVSVAFSLSLLLSRYLSLSRVPFTFRFTMMLPEVA